MDTYINYVSLMFLGLERLGSGVHLSSKPINLFHKLQCFQKPNNVASIQSQTFATSHSLEKSLETFHLRGKPKKKKRRTVMFGRPFMKGVVVRVLIKKPRKPNSANRKCVRVRTSMGHEVTAYIPKEGHNLQEHSIVLIRGGNVQDLPGVKHKVVRGKYDLGHVVKKSQQ